MNEDKGMCKYEFSDDENRLLADLSRGLTHLGILILIAGLLFVTYLIVSIIDPPSLFEVSDTKHIILSVVDYSLWILISALIVYISIMIIRLAKPVSLIAKTAGMDIPYLMEFVKDLMLMSRITFFSLIIICALMVVSLVMMILVF
ncbi:MAG: hypothetical protein C0392_14040 [Syntrophus sp. (in: bacteria)]|nr:hypothetical protein [Syntrophus sp. (in: bacteria)]